MKAITYSAFGSAREVLTLVDMDCPAPGPGEVTVDITMSGVNPSDVKSRAGRPGLDRPVFDQIIPHSDGAGVISAVGDGVPGSRVGERVWLWNGQWKRALGTAAQQITLPAEQAVPLPATVSDEVGATLGIPGLTATHAVFSGGDVRDQTVLIHGGAGTVGYLAVQLAKWGGARVITTARGAGLDRAKAAGADVAIDYSAPDLAQQILAANGGQPIPKIIDVELGVNLDIDAEVIAENGRLNAYGSAKNMTPTLPIFPLLFKAVTLEIVLVYLLTSTERRFAVDTLTAALTDGALHSPIEQIFPLEQAAAAHEAVEAGNRTGAILLSTGA
ncbi:NADPH:quinone reductase [Tropicibacter sp. R16_0]|uniref:NADPH:quinone reductase n=1 Tax=Tropicibacter sp. R16_0 TaxID=2821102 RepID=UPI001ADD0627|nr:NADPH:quinone reductase [Tropicibacter sp. R16_0]MBO9448960.1 NADPH:quinone reductase [Tropicibacter sp. R16_0]